MKEDKNRGLGYAIPSPFFVNVQSSIRKRAQNYDLLEGLQK